MFSISNSPHSKCKTSSISKRLFTDDKDDHTPFNYHFQKFEESEQPDTVLESDELEDIDEFDKNERRPLEKILEERGKNKFIFDPENGGGRRRRIKQVSRLGCLAEDE